MFFGPCCDRRLRNGSAGASPSQARNGLGKVEESMFTGVASRTRAIHEFGQNFQIGRN